MNAIATKLPTRAQFEARLSKLRELTEARDAMRVKFACKYGPNWKREYLANSERTKYETLGERESKASTVFFDTLDAIASRNWRHGIPVYWIIQNISWEMATTRDAISPVPPLAWGHSGNNAIWAEALK